MFIATYDSTIVIALCGYSYVHSLMRATMRLFICPFVDACGVQKERPGFRLAFLRAAPLVQGRKERRRRLHGGLAVDLHARRRSRRHHFRLAPLGRLEGGERRQEGSVGALILRFIRHKDRRGFGSAGVIRRGGVVPNDKIRLGNAGSCQNLGHQSARNPT
jgi:hypothetical protein